MTKQALMDRLTVPQEVFLANPYRFYRQLRKEAPVFWDQRSRAWLLTRYADVTSLKTPKCARTQSCWLDVRKLCNVGKDWAARHPATEHTAGGQHHWRAGLPRAERTQVAESAGDAL